jgi:hypothetical protein
MIVEGFSDPSVKSEVQKLLKEVSVQLKASSPSSDVAQTGSSIASVKSPARNRLFELYLQRKDMQKFSRDFKVHKMLLLKQLFSNLFLC